MRRFIFIFGSLVVVYLLGVNIYISDMHSRSPEVREGDIELTRDDLISNNHALWLHGDWEWYPKEYLSLENLRHREPQYMQGAAPWTNSFSGEQLGSFGFGTYRLHVVVPAPGRYSLFIPWVNTAYRLYVDGILMESVGHPGTSSTDHIPRYRPIQASFTVIDRSADILLHVGNFNHFEGGLVKPFLFGSHQQVSSIVTLQHATNTFIIGAMLMAASIILMFYGKTHREYRLLYIALIAFILALRTALSISMVVYRLFPDFPWELGLRLEYLTVPLAAFSFLGFFRHTYYDRFSHPVVWATQLSSLLLALTFLAAPILVLPVFMIASYIIMAVAICTWLVQTVRHRHWGTFTDRVITLGTMLFIIGAAADIINYNQPMSYFFPIEFSTITLIYFVYIIMYLNTKQFLDTLDYSRQLTEDLEVKVQQRTTELEAINRKILLLATKDDLTGLWNRTELQRRSEDETYRHNRYFNSNNPYFSVIYIDLDNFKYFNDTYTHEIGDLVLKEFSRLIISCSRKSDSHFRIGGDEFVMFLPRTDGTGAIRIARRILSGVIELNRTFERFIEEKQGKHVSIPEEKQLTCSIGIAIHGEEDLHIERLIQYADTALLQAKLFGKNQYHIYRQQDLEQE